MMGNVASPSGEHGCSRSDHERCGPSYQAIRTTIFRCHCDFAAMLEARAARDSDQLTAHFSQKVALATPTAPECLVDSVSQLESAAH